MKIIDKRYLDITFTMLIILMFGILTRAESQVVRNPVSEVSETAKHYSYTYMLSANQKKDIEYILVKASNGDVKSVFNACDVCYSAHKGYSQSGNQLRCNNCGNKFNIDQLGSQGTGGTCNPGYLPRTIDGSDVVINVSDLVKGAYFFVAQTVAEVETISKDDNNFHCSVFTKNGDLNIKMPQDTQRYFRIASLNGQNCRTFESTAKELNIDVSDLSSGIYILLVDEFGKSYVKVFCVYK